jgi:hypothetical protein
MREKSDQAARIPALKEESPGPLVARVTRTEGTVVSA